MCQLFKAREFGGLRSFGHNPYQYLHSIGIYCSICQHPKNILEYIFLSKHIFALIGKTLDRASQTKGKGSHRFERRWRPSVALATFPGVTHLHLIAGAEDEELAHQVAEDARTLNNGVRVTIDQVEFEDPWNLPSTYLALLAYIEKKMKEVGEGDECLFSHTTGSNVQQLCIFLLCESKRFRGKLLQSAPSKTVRHESQFQVIDLDLSAYDVIAKRFKGEKRDAVSVLKGGVKTRNSKFNALIEEIEHVVSGSKYPVLLMGASGVGKSDLAGRIYEIRKRIGMVTGDMVSVNCSTLKGEQLISCLFGHEKGSFTGAHAKRNGLLKAADGGVIFLDEIGDMDLEAQAMLLSAVEKKRFYPLGSDIEVSSDFMIIAGTNRNLRKEVAAGRFREDLLARLNTWEFVLPGLRDRREDIEPNIDFELERLSDELGRRICFRGEARQIYLSFALSSEALWSGNFRDLLASLTRLSTMAHDGVITVTQVEREIDRLKQCWGGVDGEPIEHDESASILVGEKFSHIDAVDMAALKMVAKKLRESSSAAEASRALFDKSRLERKIANDSDRLVKYLKQFGLKVSDLLGK